VIERLGLEPPSARGSIGRGFIPPPPPHPVATACKELAAEDGNQFQVPSSKVPRWAPSSVEYGGSRWQIAT